MMVKMVRIVLTGGPCSGKTTTANILRQMGFSVVPESAEMVIRAGKPEDNLEFQWRIFELQQELEEKYPDDGLLFLDRGVPDTIAYTRYWGYDPPKEFIEASRDRYNFVFFFDRLPFKKEGFRVENGEFDAERATRLIRQAYLELGYVLVHVPVLPPIDRVAYLLDVVYSLVGPDDKTLIESKLNYLSDNP